VAATLRFSADILRDCRLKVEGEMKSGKHRMIPKVLLAGNVFAKFKVVEYSMPARRCRLRSTLSITTLSPHQSNPTQLIGATRQQSRMIREVCVATRTGELACSVGDSNYFFLQGSRVCIQARIVHTAPHLVETSNTRSITLGYMRTRG
jgi:hypothetical protein